jgi:hypothetical protein
MAGTGFFTRFARWQDGNLKEQDFIKDLHDGKIRTNRTKGRNLK